MGQTLSEPVVEKVCDTSSFDVDLGCWEGRGSAGINIQSSGICARMQTATTTVANMSI